MEQQVVLAHRQLRLLAAHRHPPRDGVELEVAEHDRLLELGLGINPPQHRIDAGNQLGGRERLRHVVVRAEPQTDHAVRGLTLRGEEDHRDPVPVAGSPQPAHDLEAVHPRQHQVEHHEVRACLPGKLERSGAIRGRTRVVPGALQVAGHHVGDRRLVVDDQHGAARFHEAIVALCDRRARRRKAFVTPRETVSLRPPLGSTLWHRTSPAPRGREVERLAPYERLERMEQEANRACRPPRVPPRLTEPFAPAKSRGRRTATKASTSGGAGSRGVGQAPSFSGSRRAPPGPRRVRFGVPP